MKYHDPGSDMKLTRARSLRELDSRRNYSWLQSVPFHFQLLPTSQTPISLLPTPSQGVPSISPPDSPIPRCACVHHLEMSPFVPFRNVTVTVENRAAGGRGAPA